MDVLHENAVRYELNEMMVEALRGGDLDSACAKANAVGLDRLEVGHSECVALGSVLTSHRLRVNCIHAEVDDSQLSDAAQVFNELVAGIAANPSVLTLRVSAYSLSSVHEGWNALLEGWKAGTCHLRDLVLCCVLDVDQSTAIAEGLSEDTHTLQRLSVSDCWLGRTNAERFGRLLAANTRLRHLDLTATGLDDVGVAALGKGLAQNNTLQSLMVAHCRFRSEGLLALAEGVRENTSLRLLDIHLGQFESLDEFVNVCAEKHMLQVTVGQFSGPVWRRPFVPLPRLLSIVESTPVNAMSLPLKNLEMSQMERQIAVFDVCSRDADDLLEILLDDGVSPDTLVNQGLVPDHSTWFMVTALAQAVCDGHVAVARLMVERGASVHLGNPSAMEYLERIVWKIGRDDAWQTWHFMHGDHVDEAMETALAMNMEERAVMFEAGGMEDYVPEALWSTLPDEVMERVVDWMAKQEHPLAQWLQ